MKRRRSRKAGQPSIAVKHLAVLIFGVAEVVFIHLLVEIHAADAADHVDVDVAAEQEEIGFADVYFIDVFGRPPRLFDIYIWRVNHVHEQAFGNVSCAVPLNDVVEVVFVGAGHDELAISVPVSEEATPVSTS